MEGAFDRFAKDEFRREKQLPLQLGLPFTSARNAMDSFRLLLMATSSWMYKPRLKRPMWAVGNEEKRCWKAEPLAGLITPLPNSVMSLMVKRPPVARVCGVRSATLSRRKFTPNLIACAPCVVEKSSTNE